MVKTAILVSGGGMNLQAILDAHLFGELPNCELTAVISVNPDAYALERARMAKVPGYVVDAGIFPNKYSFCRALLEKLQDLSIELVVLAGFPYLLDVTFANTFRGRIINTHPSLFPAFCGEGFCGLGVHRAVLEHGVKLSGATAYFVTHELCAGPIILQKGIDVREDDTPATLQRRIMEEAEWDILPKAIRLYCEGRLSIEGQVVRIAPAE